MTEEAKDRRPAGFIPAEAKTVGPIASEPLGVRPLGEFTKAYHAFLADLKEQIEPRVPGWGAHPVHPGAFPPWMFAEKLTLGTSPAELKCRATLQPAMMVEMVRLESLLTQLSYLTKVSIDWWTVPDIATLVADPTGQKQTVHHVPIQNKVKSVIVAFGDTGVLAEQENRISSILGSAVAATAKKPATWRVYQKGQVVLKEGLSTQQVVDLYCQVSKWSLAFWASAMGKVPKAGSSEQVSVAAIPLICFQVSTDNVERDVPPSADGQKLLVTKLVFDEPKEAVEILGRLPLFTTTVRGRIPGAGAGTESAWDEYALYPDRLAEAYSPPDLFSRMGRREWRASNFTGVMGNSVTNVAPFIPFQNRVLQQREILEKSVAADEAKAAMAAKQAQSANEALLLATFDAQDAQGRLLGRRMRLRAGDHSLYTPEDVTLIVGHVRKQERARLRQQDTVKTTKAAADEMTSTPASASAPASAAAPAPALAPAAAPVAATPTPSVETIASALPPERPEGSSGPTDHVIRVETPTPS